jgi:hypothetical protein
MPSKRQPCTIRLDPADWATARQLVTARRCYDFSELIRDLIRQAADRPPTPQTPAAIADLAKRLDVSVDTALAIVGEFLGNLSATDVDCLLAHADRLKIPASRFLPAVAKVRTDIVSELLQYANGKVTT